MKRRWRSLPLRITLAILMLGICWAFYRPHWMAASLVVEDPAGFSDAVLVMGGDPQYHRTRAAASLILAGEARLLVVTGGEPGPGDSSASLAREAVRLGVPPERILAESASYNTWTSLVAVRPILSRNRILSITLVTSPYHQRRASLAARRALPGVSVRNRPAMSGWSPLNWWRDPKLRRAILREYVAIPYYWMFSWA